MSTSPVTNLLHRLLSIAHILSLAIVSQAAAAQESPHVVIILVDDMGFGDPGCFNPNSKISTPHIDSLARDGMRFTDAHAPGPLCHVSRYGLMTGRYPFRAEVGKWPRSAVIGSDRTTIASLLKSSGYRTAMVGKWHLGFDQAAYDVRWPGGPVDVGFDSYFGIRASTDIPPYFYVRDDRPVAAPTVSIEKNTTPGWSPIQGEFWRAGKIAPDMQLADVLPELIDESQMIIREHGKAIREGNTAQPLMLYVALPAPHTPWLPSKEFVGTSKVSMYGDFVMMVDAMVGRVLEALEEANLADDTLVIFTSDNGPVWYEQDVERFGHDSSGGLRGMKADAWEAGHRMPFIARWPNRVAAGSVSDQLICFTDILATLANIVGYSLSEEEGPDSFDFSPQLLGQNSTEGSSRTSLVMKSGSGLMTVRERNWKLIDGLGSGGFSKPSKRKPQPGEPEGQLYDLSTDPGETKNLYRENPDIVQRLQKILAETVHNEASAVTPRK